MKLTLVEKKSETPDVTTFIFELEQPLTWQAGQFLHYTLPDDHTDNRGAERWFTISSAPFENHIQITTRHAEKSSTFKTKLFDLPIGNTIEADGLEGDFIMDNPDEQFVFIAGGIGITPFHSILLDLDHNNVDINGKLMYANRDGNFVFKEVLDEIAAKHPNFKIHYFADNEQIDEAKIRECVPNIETPTFFISGPEPMVEIMEKIIEGMGIPEGRLKRDFFPGYEWK